RYVDLKLERIQLRILKNFPPLPAKILVIGLSGLPVPYLFIGGRRRRVRDVVLWSNRAAAQSERRYCEWNCEPTSVVPLGSHLNPLHLISPGKLACTTWTCCPDTIESGGLIMT